MSSPEGLQSSMVADGKILIAIDLGTTFSGIAWAHTARPATRSIIGQWPDIHDSLDGITSGKVPTEIYYDEASIKWGFQIPEFEKRYQCFKLELESSVAKDSSHLGLLYPDPKSLRVNQRTTGEVLISEYLTCLRKHISEILKISLCDNVLETTTLEYIISVPAIWSEAARAKTRSCAERAGMSAGLQLVLEPEAAIMHAVDQELSQMDVGDIVVVCDAGGGTVDLISYIIDQREPTLDISEAAPGTGNACGSNFLNRMFRQKLQERFGRFPGWGDDTLQEALEYFERVVKRKFNGNQDQWLVPVPGLPDDKDAGIRRGKLIMSGNEIRTLFEPVIAIITSLLQMQIAISKRKGTIKIVYLVGGFGESAYLRESLKKVVPEAIQVISPANAWTAVVRGALIKGLAAASPSAAKVKVGSRVARKAYGIKVREKFNANMHQDHQKYYDSFEGHYLVDIMDWFVAKGHKLKEDEEFSVDYHAVQPVSDSHINKVKLRLYSFESRTDRAPPLYQEDGAKELAKLTADLSSIPTSMLPIKKGADRKKYYHITYQIRVNFKPAHMTYSLWYKNTCWGTVDAEYR